MYGVGDKIVYPSHGAGTIEAIEEKLILGKRKKYYIMRISAGNITVMIPMDNCSEIGVRDIIDKAEAKKVLEMFKSEPVADDLNWNKRQRDNMSKIRTGDIYQSAGVLKNLMYRDKTKGLSTSERKMLNNVRQIVVSELVLSGVAPREDIEAILNDIVEAIL